MPAFIVPNTVQARLNWQMGGQTGIVSVLHGLVPTEFDVTAAISDMAGKVATAWTDANIGSLMHVDTDILSLDLIDIRSDVIKEANAPVTGATGVMGAGQLLPRDTQMCVTLRTARRGRSFRGRVFLPGWGEIANDTGRATSAAVAAGDLFVTQLRAWWGAEDFTLAVCSRKLLQSNAVTSVIVRDDRWDTMRKRDR